MNQKVDYNMKWHRHAECRNFCCQYHQYYDIIIMIIVHYHCNLLFIHWCMIIIYCFILFEGAILQWSLYSSNFGNKLWCFSWSFSSVQNLLWDGSIFLSFHGTEYWCQFREGLSSRFKQRVCIEDPVWSWIIFARTDHVTARFVHGAPAVNSSCRHTTYSMFDFSSYLKLTMKTF